MTRDFENSQDRNFSGGANYLTAPQERSVIFTINANFKIVMKHISLFSAILVAAAISLGGCRWLEVDPEQFILADDALETPEDLQALLVSCYDVMANLKMTGTCS